MNYDFKNTLIRLEKITKTLTQLVEDNKNLRIKLSKRDEPLIAKVRRLEQALTSMNEQAAARERVLTSLTASKEMPSLEEIKKQIRDKDKQTVN